MADDQKSRKSLFHHLPDPPLLAAGALGGPFVIASLTPLRNAMSNAAQDQQSSFAQLYRRTFGAPTLSPVNPCLLADVLEVYPDSIL